MPITAPFFPIIYVRGYAGNDSEIEDTVSDPYMGFNLGSTKLRQLWTGKVERHYFESPLVRLMKDFGYRDVYSAGLDMVPDRPLDPKSIIIYRYYDKVSADFGGGEQLRMETFGADLNDLIERVRDSVCTDPADRESFKVYLVGHSMGGLVIRCFLQNDAIGRPETKALVDKAFTYATPHNGIELEIIGNVPSFFTRNSADNFNRERMAQYLGLPAGTDPVHSLNGRFDADRFFCLVGTNAKDYAVASGWSSRVVGPFSDGLVRIANAAVTALTGIPDCPERLAPRAFVHRSHSGPYGIVNSEEGYQNLTRFLFGNVRVEGVLEVHALSLPEDIQAFKDGGQQIRASYHFECVTRVRGANWDLSRRLAAENSTVFRKFGELFPDKAENYDRPHHDRPQLFTTYLNAASRVDPQRPSLGFSLDLGVLVPEYEVDGVLWLKNHYPGGYLFREKFNLEAIPPEEPAGQWRLRYGTDSTSPNRTTQDAVGTPTAGGLEFRIPVVQRTRPGIEAMLVLTAAPWNS
ncbi:hypothetical protein [Roseomonas sp. BN140053]|uniref:PGAP1-like alpha/beta domain-containing protein n=1 Tax=Roseomonas sp. BN140053 TaxID=3391898 RepID=UPI0039EBBBD0